jgi:iron complex outermembrane receptor protein
MKLRSIILATPISLTLAVGQSAHETAATMLDEVVVTATPMERTLFQQAQPVSILTGDELKLRLEPTLGETLSRTPGVTSTYFGPGASRPVIRGLAGDRIRILQNGSNTIDASTTSADHAVSFDPISLESIEVVRGPATLLYGPNAIGGVVNAIDNRIPNERIGVPVRGTVAGRHGSVNTERGGAFTLEGGVRGFNYHLEGYKRATDELRIPGYARSERLRERDPLPEGEKEARDVLPNSDLRTEGLSGGLSHTWEKGFFGVAYSGFHTNYGVVAEREVTIDLEQRRWDARGAFFEPITGIKSVKYSLGFSDYEHTEFEGPFVGTRFENEGYDGRVEIAHEKLGPLEGAIGYQSQKSTFSALGEEAFLPPTETVSNSAFIFEEVTLHPKLRLQTGARYDHIEVSADPAIGFGEGRARTFDNLSGSAGLIYTPLDDYAIALNAAYTQRAPTYQEQFANGPHVATGSFEIGDSDLPVEKVFSLDLSVRKKAGRVTGAITGFYYRFTDYVGQFANGQFVPGEEDELPVFLYRSTDAEFFGGELEVTIHLHQHSPALAETAVDGKTTIDRKAVTAPTIPESAHLLDLVLKSDYVHATDLETGRPLPRIPPFRASAALNYEYKRFSASLEGQYSAHQSRISAYEWATDSFFLLNASLGYKLPVAGYELDAYVKGVNLTDEEARLHTSFLKEIAPLAGRGVLVGLRARF